MKTVKARLLRFISEWLIYRSGGRMSIAERYSEMLRSVWTPEQRRAMKQAATAYKECVKNAWKKGGVTKAELEACARQAGIPERYHGIITGGV